MSPQDAKARVTELWHQADTGRAFAAALEADGWSLARGDRRDFVIVDQAGEVHSLAKRIDGVKAAQVRERMADIDPASLPSAAQAKERQRDQLQQAVDTQTNPVDALNVPEVEIHQPEREATVRASIAADEPE